jgi:hypothetical protein
MKKYFVPILVLSWSFAFAQTTDLQKLLRDPAREDEIVDGLVGNHAIIMKLIDKMSEHPHFVEMMKERFGADVKSGGGSPYAGEEGREIKALSAEQVTQYLEGEGMGLAKPAELNGYPGPRHVLDLSDRLNLNSGQAKSVKDEFDRMHGDATRLGARIVAEERAIDSLFRTRSMSQALLDARIRKSASLQGELRLAHLRSHLKTTEILTPAQRENYMVLRGYAQKGEGSQHKK